MKAMIATLVMLMSLDLFALEERRYRSYGQIQFNRHHVSCEIHNNIDLTGRVHKIAFDFRCRDYRYPGYHDVTELYRCGEDYENCDIEGYDFEIFRGPNLRRVCHEVVQAQCRFTYSFPDELNDNPGDEPIEDPDNPTEPIEDPDLI